MANLTTAKTFREYAAIEGANHPPIPEFFDHARPDGDAISPAGVLIGGVIVPPVFTVVAATNLFTTVGHGLVAGTPILPASAGTLPGGLGATVPVYVIASGLTDDNFKVSATLGGSELDITDAGTGIHSWSRYLTAEEQAEVDKWLIDKRDDHLALPGSILWVAARHAYEVNPRHRSWMTDDYYQRHWQAYWRSADHAEAAQPVSPPSASDTGDVTDPPPDIPIPRGSL